jgi:ABC-type nitrate/sulfonate/bicarbonate transport system substrate-binding protein
MVAHPGHRGRRATGLRPRATSACRLARSAIGLLLLLTECLWPLPAALGAALEPVRVVYFWPVQGFLLIPIVVAQKRGIYARQGLDVSIELPPDAQTTARMLAVGQADIAMEPRTDVVFAANIDLPLISIANYDQHNSWCVVGRPGEPIELAALRGKKIGIFTDSWTAVMMRMLFDRTGIRDPDDVEQIITQFEDMPLLLAGRLDLATNTAPFAVAESMVGTGKMPNLACPDRTGIPDIPVWSFTATPGWLKTHGSTARAWLAATLEALDWSVMHPKEAAKLFAATYPLVDSPLYDEVGWAAALPYLEGPGGYLRQSDASWAELAAGMQRIGLISEVKPLSTYYTNEYLPR